MPTDINAPTSEMADRSAPKWMVWIALLFAAVWLAVLGARRLSPDEGRYAEIPREMLQRSDLIVPVLQGDPYLDKPPLLYWLVAASYRLFGVSEAAATAASSSTDRNCSASAGED